MKKWVFVLGLVLSFNAYAQNSGSCAPTDENGFEIGSCHWTLDSGNLTISGEGPIRGYDQIYYDESINYGFSDAPWGINVDSITIEEGITSIGFKAFSGTQATNIHLPDSLTDISTRAFQFANKLESINIPDSVTSIGDYTFDTCTNLESITIPENIVSIGEGAFIRSGLKNVVLPDSVETIGGWVFEGSTDLASVIIGDKVTSIGEGAFSGTSGYVYCQESENHGGKSCAELVGGSGLASGKLKVYTIENGKVKVGSKTYNGLSDLPQYVLKRIYTIDEANKVAGDKNMVKIKYR